MNHFHTSYGERVSKEEIDRRTKAAKKEKLQQQIDNIGYNVCEECYLNDCKPLDCAHLISVDEAQKTGRAELCWDVENIKVMGRDCHRKHDKNGVVSAKIK